MERTFSHAVTYTNRGRVAVSDVAASLLANEQLMREAIQALEDVFPGLQVHDVSVVFRQATSNSPLREAMEAVVNIVFQEDLAERIPAAISALIGADIPEDYEGMITIITIAIVAYGVYWALSKIGKKDAPEGLTVLGNYNQIIQVGRDMIGVDEEVVKAAVEKRFAKSRGPVIARRALEMLRPAQREPGAGVTGGGAVIAPETVAAAPAALNGDPGEDLETQESYTDQRIVVHATDKDSHKSGWAGHLPGIWEKRLPMRLFPAIDPKSVFGKDEIVGDVIVVSKKNLDGDYIPYVFHVVGIG